MSTEPEQPETDTETEIEVEASEQAPLDALIRAAAIAKQVFGTADVYATGEIADYLGEDPTEKAKKEFAADLQRSYDYAGVVFEVEKPTAEQVFFILERVIL